MASPDQTPPWVMTGQAWIHDPVGSPPEPVNGLSATLTGAAAVRLDLKRMRIDTSRRIKAQLSTDGPVELMLIGDWRSSAGRAGRSPRVALNGSRLPARLEGGRLALRIPEGTSTLRIRPPAR